MLQQVFVAAIELATPPAWTMMMSRVIGRIWRARQTGDFPVDLLDFLCIRSFFFMFALMDIVSF
jgi:hypothetical protein